MEIYREVVQSVNVSVPPSSIPTNITVVTHDGVSHKVPLATKVSNGLYSISIPYAAVQFNGDLTLKYNIVVEGKRYEKQQELTVVTPLIDVSKLVDDDAKSTERLVRQIIQGYTGQRFGLYSGPIVIEGSGTGQLKLPYRLVSLDSVSANSIALQTSFLDIKSDGWYLSYKRGYMSSDGGLINSWSKFGRDSKFVVTGKWGYLRVPQPVLEAANLLFDDLSCEESTYVQKYLSSIRYGDTSMEFKDSAFRGTGNSIADKLLDGYRYYNLVVI